MGLGENPQLLKHHKQNGVLKADILLRVSYKRCRILIRYICGIWQSNNSILYVWSWWLLAAYEQSSWDEKSRVQNVFVASLPRQSSFPFLRRVSSLGWKRADHVDGKPLPATQRRLVNAFDAGCTALIKPIVGGAGENVQAGPGAGARDACATRGADGEEEAAAAAGRARTTAQWRQCWPHGMMRARGSARHKIGAHVLMYQSGHHANCASSFFALRSLRSLSVLSYQIETKPLAHSSLSDTLLEGQRKGWFLQAIYSYRPCIRKYINLTFTLVIKRHYLWL